ncbi:MAG: hypothetical protein IPJ69_11530 [Deltaproteobacteria bacterium]|nr:MAG: hypothetical protein IPJ69_11530 [Deltaproteobacteria bacterium]
MQISSPTSMYYSPVTGALRNPETIDQRVRASIDTFVSWDDSRRDDLAALLYRGCHANELPANVKVLPSVFDSRVVKLLSGETVGFLIHGVNTVISTSPFDIQKTMREEFLIL